MKGRLGYWAWLWRNHQWWFLRPLPPEEWDTVIYTGLPGAGKTLFSADRAIRYMRQGVRVYSNVYIRDTYTGQEALPIRSWLDVLRASVEACESRESVMLYLAEIQELCDARLWQQTPPWWSELMQQRRHMGLGLMADTQHIDQVEKRLRMLVGRVVQVRPSPLRSFWRRWPRFQYRNIDTQLGDDPKDWTAEGRWHTIWQYSHAFHGHASWEMVGAASWEDFTDPATQKEIEELRRRAVEANKVDRLPAFTDSPCEVTE